MKFIVGCKDISWFVDAFEESRGQFIQISNCQTVWRQVSSRKLWSLWSLIIFVASPYLSQLLVSVFSFPFATCFSVSGSIFLNCLYLSVSLSLSLFCLSLFLTVSLTACVCLSVSLPLLIFFSSYWMQICFMSGEFGCKDINMIHSTEDASLMRHQRNDNGMCDHSFRSFFRFTSFHNFPLSSRPSYSFES